MNLKKSVMILLVCVSIVLALEILTPINLVSVVFGQANSNAPWHPLSQVQIDSTLNMGPTYGINVGTSGINVAGSGGIDTGWINVRGVLTTNSLKVTAGGISQLSGGIWSTDPFVGFYTSSGNALPVKVGSLAITGDYTNINAPASGLYVQGSAYLRDLKLTEKYYWLAINQNNNFPACNEANEGTIIYARMYVVSAADVPAGGGIFTCLNAGGSVYRYYKLDAAAVT